MDNKTLIMLAQEKAEMELAELEHIAEIEKLAENPIASNVLGIESKPTPGLADRISAVRNYLDHLRGLNHGR